MRSGNGKRRQAAGRRNGRQMAAARGAGRFDATGPGGGAAAAGAAIPAGERLRRASNARTAGRPSKAGERGTAYTSRYYLWSLLAGGWLFTVFASLMRGQMPEIFVAVILTGIMLQGLLPIAAARTARLTLSRELSSVEASAGGELKVTITVRSRIPLPLLWVSIQETLVNDSGAEARTVHFRHITLPWISPEWRIHYTVRGLERGEYRFRPMETVFGDMLGLTAVRCRIGSADQGRGDSAHVNLSPAFLVLPVWHGTAAAPGYGGRRTAVQESGQGGDGQSSHIGRTTRSRQRPTTADRSGTQRMPYRPGDDARRIDWRAAARGGAWTTKREWTSRPPELLVIMDALSASYDGEDRLFDCAAGYTAELIRQAAAEKIPFRLLGEEHRDKSSRGAAGSRRSHEREALERLARMRPLTAAPSGAGGMGIWPGTDNRFPRGATIIVVTAEWRNGALGERLAALAAASGCRPEVHVLTASKVPSIAMRERKRDWESAGIRVVWTMIPDDEALPGQGAVAEGGDADEGASG